MTNIWFSSAFLYIGDTMLVACLILGTIWAIAAIVRLSRRYIILDVDSRTLKLLLAVWIASLLFALVAFKFLVLDSASPYPKSTLTGTRGSVQFSTAGELVAFALAGCGVVAWARYIKRLARLVRE